MLFTNYDDKINFIYKHYRKRMVAFACRYLENSDFAEDAFHDSFFDIIKLIEKINIKSEDKMPPIIFQIVKYRSIDINRKNKQNKWVNIDKNEMIFIAKRSDLEEKIVNNINREAIIKNIGKMSDNHRKILVYRLLFDMSFKEISKITKTREDCLRKRYERARRRLCQEIEGEVL